MITLDQYFGSKLNHPDATPECVDNAINLLIRVNCLLLDAKESGLKLQNNPATKSLISGKTEGGFRLGTTTTGKPSSSHKVGMGIDIYDIGDKLDGWITRDRLVKHNLYREAVKFTSGWCHLQTREPKSKNRSFLP